MGLVDNIISGTLSTIVGSISGLFSGLAQALGGALGKKIRAPERWEKIKVDEEFKKFSFTGSPQEGYNVYYSGPETADRNGRVAGQMSSYDFRGFENKTEQQALYHLVYKLEMIHDYMKNRELALKFAKTLLTDIQSKLPKKSA